MTNNPQKAFSSRPLKLFDKVLVKSENVVGFIVDISGDWYAVEKEGNEGPIYWELKATDLELVDRMC